MYMMVHPNPLHCLSLLSQLPGVRFDINILPYQAGPLPGKIQKNKLQDPLPCQPWSAYLHHSMVPAIPNKLVTSTIITPAVPSTAASLPAAPLARAGMDQGNNHHALIIFM
jgi:hypothetical protein